jgi:hypothetical protein
MQFAAKVAVFGDGVEAWVTPFVVEQATLAAIKGLGSPVLGSTEVQ